VTFDFCPFSSLRQNPDTKVSLEALSPDVSISCILNCAEVLASAVCIVAGIEAENVAAVEACGDFGVSKVSSMLTPCIKLLRLTLGNYSFAAAANAFPSLVPS
jgi:hypothetical protein